MAAGVGDGVVGELRMIEVQCDPELGDVLRPEAARAVDEVDAPAAIPMRIAPRLAGLRQPVPRQTEHSTSE